MKTIALSKNNFCRITEFAALFFGIPAVLFFHATRWNVHICLWAASVYALVLLHREGGISWRELWNGTGWKREQIKAAALRFTVAAPLIVLLTCYLQPQRLFAFPLERPVFWVVVMVLYPILSVIPQELVFRSFFFRRYQTLFANKNAMILISALCFALVHIVFRNFVSPPLCFIAGLMFAYSYTQHKSLKWAVAEHAIYGCMVFTVGIGSYFLVGGGFHH